MFFFFLIMRFFCFFLNEHSFDGLSLLYPRNYGDLVCNSFKNSSNRVVKMKYNATIIEMVKRNFLLWNLMHPQIYLLFIFHKKKIRHPFGLGATTYFFFSTSINLSFLSQFDHWNKKNECFWLRNQKQMCIFIPHLFHPKEVFFDFHVFFFSP